MFHEKLKELRNSKKITQEKIAEFLYIKRSTYAKYETGENEPDYKTLELLANFFEVSTDYLLGRTNKKTTARANTQELKDIFKKEITFNGHLLNKEKKEKIIKLLEILL